MARTKQTARKSTGGMAPRRQLASKSCTWGSRPALATPPDRIGVWTRNRIGPRVTKGRSRDLRDQSRFSLIALPNHWAIQGKWRRKRMAALSFVGRTRHIKSRASYNPLARLESLPVETLLQILSPLVRTGNTYHFSPTGLKAPFSVHHLESSGQGTAIPDPTSVMNLALVCRRFRETVYDIFYGQNQFVIELVDPTIQLTTYINTRPLTDEPGGIGAFHSWNKFSMPAVGVLTLSSPLSLRTIQHVTDLTLSINLTSSDPKSAECNALKSKLHDIASCLNHSDHRLKLLAVSLDVLGRLQTRYTSFQLELQHRKSSVASAGNTVGIGIAKIEDFHASPPHTLETPPPPPVKAAESILEPLLRIRGLREVRTGRHISGEFHDRLERSSQFVRPSRKAQ